MRWGIETGSFLMNHDKLVKNKDLIWQLHSGDATRGEKNTCITT